MTHSSNWLFFRLLLTNARTLFISRVWRFISALSPGGIMDPKSHSGRQVISRKAR